MYIYYVYQYLRSKDSTVAESDTPYYIGKGKGRRAWCNNHCISIPSDKSLIEILVTGLSEKAAHELEIMLIKQYGRIDLGTGILRNQTNGGEGTAGAVKSAKTREKISNSNKGKKGPRLGITVSEETKTKMRLAKLGKPSNFKGKIVSQETRLLMSKPKSADTRAKMSASRKSKKRGPYKTT